MIAYGMTKMEKVIFHIFAQLVPGYLLELRIVTIGQFLDVPFEVVGILFRNIRPYIVHCVAEMLLQNLSLVDTAFLVIVVFNASDRRCRLRYDDIRPIHFFLFFLLNLPDVLPDIMNFGLQEFLVKELAGIKPAKEEKPKRTKRAAKKAVVDSDDNPLED